LLFPRRARYVTSHFAQYETAHSSISGMGMSGWESGTIRGNILCIKQEFAIAKGDSPTELKLNGTTLTKQ